MDNLLKKLNNPKAILFALVLVLLVNSFLFYYFRLSEPSGRTVEPPGSQLVQEATDIMLPDNEQASDDEIDGSDSEEVDSLEAVEVATNIPLPGTTKFDETESSDSGSEEESILGGVLSGGDSGAALALTPGFGTTAAPPAPVPEPTSDEESISREIAGTVLAPVASVSPVGPASNEQPENQGFFETAAAALEPISQGSAPATPIPVLDFFVPSASSNEVPTPATPLPDFFIPPSNEVPVPATPLPVPDFFLPDSSFTEVPAPVPAFPTPVPAPDSSFVEPAAPEAPKDTSEQSPLPPVEQSPLPPSEQSPPPPSEQSPPPPSVGQLPPSDCQQPLPPPSGSQQPLPPPSDCQQPLPPPSGSQQPAGLQQPPPSGGAQ